MYHFIWYIMIEARRIISIPHSIAFAGPVAGERERRRRELRRKAPWADKGNVV